MLQKSNYRPNCRDVRSCIPENQRIEFGCWSSPTFSSFETNRPHGAPEGAVQRGGQVWGVARLRKVGLFHGIAADKVPIVRDVRTSIYAIWRIILGLQRFFRSLRSFRPSVLFAEGRKKNGGAAGRPAHRHCGVVCLRLESVYAEVFLDFFNFGVGLVDGFIVVGSGFHLAFDFDIEFDFRLCAGGAD